MKKYYFIPILLMSFLNSYSQVRAVTENGDEVILYADGSWEYLDQEVLEAKEIPTNERAFKKSESSSFLVKSNKLKLGIWINPKVWKFEKNQEADASEFTFQKKGEDLYGMLISERVEIPIETLKGIALENARSVAPDIKVTNEEYRMVNGQKMLMMQMSGTIQGIKFTYFGYYYSYSEGTIQFLTYTSQNLFETYFDDMEALLNGVVLLEK